MKSRGAGQFARVFLLCCSIFVVFSLCGCRKKCSMPDCRNERAEGSEYCYLHDLSNRVYGNPDYNEVYEQSRERQEDTNSSTGGDMDSSTDSSWTENRNDTSSEYDSSGKNEAPSRKIYDPFDADEYADGDEFADEWAEEFGEGEFEDGYDDAYDYWEEMME